MILELDAGNSFVKWRLLENGQRVEGGRVPTRRLEALPELPGGVARARACSVAGSGVDRQLSRWAARFGVDLEFAVVERRWAGLTNSYRQPERMGADRWVAMLAAYRPQEGPCCVVDCGSAITVDLIDATGHHRGGYILPGMGLLRESLLRNTASVRVDERSRSLRTAPGRSTDEAVEHGINLLIAALGERLLRDLERLEPGACQVWITGGDGAQFQALLGAGTYREELVLDGLAIALP